MNYAIKLVVCHLNLSGSKEMCVHRIYLHLYTVINLITSQPGSWVSNVQWLQVPDGGSLYNQVFTVTKGPFKRYVTLFPMEFDPRPPPRNANNVEPYTFITLFPGKADTPTPHGVQSFQVSRFGGRSPDF